jgi:hypothetical protein
MAKRSEELRFLAISGLKFPTDSREYLMNLSRDAAIKHQVQFIVIAGGTIDGPALETELKAQMAFEIAKIKAAAKKAHATYGTRGFTFDAAAFETKFVESVASDLNDFLPKIEGVNYHIVIAEKVYERRIGIRILKALRKMRPDIRLIGEKEDGTFDNEVQLPVRMPGFEVIRVLVPRQKPWYYRIITSFMQRLINSFVSRTFSQRPDLILVGCTGTQAYLPYYEGVPSISVPALHKINEQKSTENMVGCVVVRVIVKPDRAPEITVRTYNFRPVVSRERELSIPNDTSPLEKRILHALKISPASINTILFRIANDAKKQNERPPRITEARAQTVLKSLQERKLVIFRQSSNRYAIDERNIGNLKMSLDDLLKDARTTKHIVTSCVHVGALKSLYHTRLNYFPQRANETDAIIETGDLIQGIAHNYEYNGELLPGCNGFDKQEILAAHITGKVILDIFRCRLKTLIKEFPDRKPTAEEIFRRKCLIQYVFISGNHPEWIYSTRHSLVLYGYERELRALLIDGILTECNKAGISMPYALASAEVDKHVTRVGESQLTHVDGFLIGMKHPSKARTLSKSQRIQEVVDFYGSTAIPFLEMMQKEPRDFAVVYVANFHEAASAHIAKFGKIVFGVMTGAYVKDTSFERSKDKVVDNGFAIVSVCMNGADLIWTEVEYDNYIHPDDRKFVFADKITMRDINALSDTLTNVVDIPWRL